MRFVGLALLATGCATAGNGNGNGSGNPDAPSGVIDAPMQVIDSAKLVDAPSQATCNSGAMCSGAMDIGSVSGDSGNATVQASGYESAWFKVRVTEDDSNPFGVPMNLTVNLTSPPGVNFDLYLYVNSGSDVVECSTSAGQSMNTGTTDQAHISWGETGTFSNGTSDTRTVSIEVRPVSGTCAASSMFQLIVYGDL
jgi:hypothetical protein